MQIAATSRSACGPVPAASARSSAASAVAAPRRCVRVRAVGPEDVQSAIASNPLFHNSQFMGVLQDSLARQGADALTRSAQPAEPRICATEEVLTTALHQSKQTLQQLLAWRDQLERQIKIQEKQVDRMEFALNKSRNDAAYMRAMKNMMHQD